MNTNFKPRPAGIDQDGRRIRTHSASGYNRGCRCEICRAADVARRRSKSPNPRPPLRERLFSGLVIDPSGCVLWTHRVNNHGYGLISVNNREQLVHRVMWQLCVGPIPDGLELDHVAERGCRYRNCANIAHLEPVTHRENLMRGSGPTAINAALEQCPAGHDYDLINTYFDRNGGRKCRACHRERMRVSRAQAKRAA